MLVNEAMLKRVAPKVDAIKSSQGTSSGHALALAAFVVIFLVLWYRNKCKRENKPI